MCLLVVLVGTQREFPLVVAANRDELFDRPAVPMAVLREQAPRILGGRDSVAGGTWLAVNDAGVAAALTNRPRLGGGDPTKRSRGELPVALATHSSAVDAVRAFGSRFRPADYNAAWLIVGDRESTFYIDMTDGETPEVQRLSPGVHVLENRPLGAPSPKVDRVRALLGGIGDVPADQLTRRLQLILGDHVVPAGPSAAADIGVEAVPPEVKAACVHTERYGTRWSGVITVPQDRDLAPVFHYTDGPPCQGNDLRADALWTS